MQFARIRILRRATYGRRAIQCARELSVKFHIHADQRYAEKFVRQTAPGTARLAPSHALNGCKPKAPSFSSQVDQMTNMRKQPVSRLAAVSILRIEHPRPCTLCRFVFIRSCYQAFCLLSDISGAFRSRAYAELELPQSGQGLIVCPGSFRKGPRGIAGGWNQGGEPPHSLPGPGKVAPGGVAE